MFPIRFHSCVAVFYREDVVCVLLRDRGDLVLLPYDQPLDPPLWRVSEDKVETWICVGTFLIGTDSVQVRSIIDGSVVEQWDRDGQIWIGNCRRVVCQIFDRRIIVRNSHLEVVRIDSFDRPLSDNIIVGELDMSVRVFFDTDWIMVDAQGVQTQHTYRLPAFMRDPECSYFAFENETVIHRNILCGADGKLHQLPGKVSAVSVSEDGHYLCACDTVCDKTVLIEVTVPWQVCNTCLLNKIDEFFHAGDELVGYCSKDKILTGKLGDLRHGVCEVFQVSGTTSQAAMVAYVDERECLQLLLC